MYVTSAQVKQIVTALEDMSETSKVFAKLWLLQLKLQAKAQEADDLESEIDYLEKEIEKLSK